MANLRIEGQVECKGHGKSAKWYKIYEPPDYKIKNHLDFTEGNAVQGYFLI